MYLRIALVVLLALGLSTSVGTAAPRTIRAERTAAKAAAAGSRHAPPGGAAARGSSLGRTRSLAQRPAGALERAMKPLTRRAALGAHIHRTDFAIRLPAHDGRSRAPYLWQQAAFWKRDPLLYRVIAALRGIRSGRAETTLQRQVARLEAIVGPIEVPSGVAVERALFYRAERAASLKLYGRTAKDVSATYVHVDPTTVRAPGRPAVEVAARSIHVETWKAVGPRRGIVRIAPGYQETAGSFHYLADTLNRRGIEVLLMDAQWAGDSTGAVAPGQVDSPEGIARDAAAVDGYLELAAGAAGVPFAVMGSSLGGGAGSLLEQQLVQSGAFASLSASVDGRVLAPPRGRPPIVALAPFVSAAPRPTNRVLAVFARIPWLRSLPLPSPPIPRYASWRGQAEVAGAAARSESMARAEALVRGTLSTSARQAIGELSNPIVVVMAAEDPLADVAAVRATVPGSTFRWYVGDGVADHVLQHNEEAVNDIADLLMAQLGAPAPAARRRP